MPKLKNLVCRTCLQTNKVIYLGIFEHYKHEKLLSDMLRECTAVQVDRYDCLPLYMCNDCIEELLSAWKFKTMVVESDLKLRRNDVLQKNAKTTQRFITDKCSNRINDTVTKNLVNEVEVNDPTTKSDLKKTPSNDENVNINDLGNKECIEISSETSYEDNLERTCSKNEFPILANDERDNYATMKRGIDIFT
ncbi:zinc-finger associated domain (zf-ad) [Holotrichia oblita]|uniref:Zinc-finger associated domain (Zf-ad) n=2 Tax=Holotrichia oblita TaxID=644536 RepID=A0ACB9SN12_HOLOL|nr:zinc-finger associated domain (zf-ad) [Holotrichia oblita]KAI4455147.1 zinc-finger associated domain (zf-ad) [Holotrichia oblita]